MTMKKRCSKTDRLERLKENGGTPACEDAVVKSLDWLKQRQHEDGSWCATHQSATTGLALLAYLGHCETPVSEQYGETVLRAIVFLVAKAAKNQGRLVDGFNDPLWPYEHAIATCALAEACTFARQQKVNIPGLEDAVRNAGQWITDNQAKAGGDILLTCVNLQALKACKETGLDFKNLTACVGKALDTLKAGQDTAGARALVYQQWGKGSTQIARSACESLAEQAKFQWNSPDADLCALYFNAHAMMNRGGKQWIDFNAMFLPEVLSAQAPDGSFKNFGTGDRGKLLPFARQLSGDDETAVHCRTCLAALTLEVYYRFLPGTGQRP